MHYSYTLIKYWGMNKMADISQTILLDALIWKINLYAYINDVLFVYV